MISFLGWRLFSVMGVMLIALLLLCMGLQVGGVWFLCVAIPLLIFLFVEWVHHRCIRIPRFFQRATVFYFLAQLSLPVLILGILFFSLRHLSVVSVLDAWARPWLSGGLFLVMSFYFSHSIWNLLIDLGVTPTRMSRRISSVFCVILFFSLGVFYLV